jgi:hypothetical protein
MRPTSDSPTGAELGAAGNQQQTSLLAPALNALGMRTAADLRERWRATGQGERGVIICAALRDATRTEHALLVRALALGAALDLSCDALLSLLASEEGNSAP